MASRTLLTYAPNRRNPHDVLRRLLEALPEGTPGEGPDGPVARLETEVAQLLGKEAAVFFPTGTMAQQVALRLHCHSRGRPTFAAHPANHLVSWEEDGYAVVHHLRCKVVGDRWRVMRLEDLQTAAEPLGAVLWELPQRDIGGQLPTWEDLGAQTAWARSVGAGVHMDGARLWEAQPAYDRSLAEIAALFDTVYVSLYKSLEAPRGAVLTGPAAFVAEARVWRHRLGGEIPEAWPLAAAGLLGLRDVLPRMAEFRDHAVALAAAITADGVAGVLPDPPVTPLFHVLLPVGPTAAAAAHARLVERRDVELFGRMRSAADPHACAAEVTVGLNALELAPEEVAALVREMVTDAREAEGW